MSSNFKTALIMT